MNSIARQLRKHQTEAEARLWYFFRDRRFLGFKFRRQYKIGSYVVDFCCIERMLVVEIDGSQHSLQKVQDEKRTAYLEQMGYRVVRFWNHEVLQQTKTVLEAIRAVLILPPHLDPLPRGGEELQDIKRSIPIGKDH